MKKSLPAVSDFRMQATGESEDLFRPTERGNGRRFHRSQKEKAKKGEKQRKQAVGEGKRQKNHVFQEKSTKTEQTAIKRNWGEAEVVENRRWRGGGGRGWRQIGTPE